MEINLEIGTKQQKSVLPLNYQYPLASWIYKTIHLSDPVFSAWLHEQGYSYEKRRFKLFTFSPFSFDRYEIQGDRFVGLGGRSALTLKFLLPESVQHFVQGCFSSQSFGIGDKNSQADFEVRQLEMKAEPEFREKMRFRAVSPVCISRPEERNGRLIAQYLHPEEADYAARLFNNLAEKFQAANPGAKLPDREQKFKILSKPRSKLITIKKGEAGESKVRAYLYDFEIEASPELLRVGYYAGFGEKNSMGFGMGEVTR